MKDKNNKVYCRECQYYSPDYNSKFDCFIPYYEETYLSEYTTRWHPSKCSEKNKDLNCVEFEKKHWLFKSRMKRKEYKPFTKSKFELDMLNVIKEEG